MSLPLVLAAAAQAQSREERAFLRSAANHFGVDEGEVAFLYQGAGDAQEIPVVLHLSTRAGVSAEAVLALRRAGTSWSDLYRRYGMHPGQLHVALDRPPREGPLASAYREFEARPRRGWEVIRLEDQSFEALVILSFLVEYLDLPPDRVALALTEEADAVQAYRRLLSRRMP